VYRWFISLWDSGKSVFTEHLYPELIVATQDYSGDYSGPKGVVNLPCDIQIKALLDSNQ
jgi:hypothetical protein